MVVPITVIRTLQLNREVQQKQGRRLIEADLLPQRLQLREVLAGKKICHVLNEHHGLIVARHVLIVEQVPVRHLEHQLLLSCHLV